MFIVRFPSGVSITYNSAGYLIYKQCCWELYTKKPGLGGTWVASIAPEGGGVVESDGYMACKVENPAANPIGNGAVDLLIENIRSVTSWKLKRLKVALRGFNMRTMSRKD